MVTEDELNNFIRIEYLERKAELVKELREINGQLEKL
jgi:hypothetical protein